MLGTHEKADGGESPSAIKNEGEAKTTLADSN
jgi:hypothetical protein